MGTNRRCGPDIEESIPNLANTMDAATSRRRPT
jgi:hypothetical protein